MMGDFQMERQEIINTPFGEPSGPLVHGHLHGHKVVFLARHGNSRLLSTRPVLERMTNL